MLPELTSRLPTRRPPISPQRIVLILPCCIGDVVLATATLKALRRGYPNAHIVWAVGSWSKAAIENHDLLDAVLDTGAEALPVRSPSGFIRFVRQLRAGQFDLAVSLVRSPLMSLAVLLSGIPFRAGLDSAGRGFGYNLRAPIDPNARRNEADLYLDVARVLGLSVDDCKANVPVREADVMAVRERMEALGITRYLVINPAGGSNPGMVMDVKRWPAANFAELGNRLSKRLEAKIVLLGGPKDGHLLEAVQGGLTGPAVTFAGVLSFPEIGALAREAVVYIGNDTGLTHYAAAAGARTVMILGPSDPVRYAPFTSNSVALWKPAEVHARGVAAGAPTGWDWARDGISVDEVEARVMAFLGMC
ncbi:MAG: glycosyltransferase family 9 protein [Chloroflexota bacterium]|nr:MAG: hypothetical protein DIU68_01230 [Chloroflexota bacterium]